MSDWQPPTYNQICSPSNPQAAATQQSPAAEAAADWVAAVEAAAKATQPSANATSARDAASLSALRFAELAINEPRGSKEPAPTKPPAAVSKEPEQPDDVLITLLPSELGVIILSNLPPPCIARASRSCQTLRAWALRAVPGIDEIIGSSFTTDNVDQGIRWLMKAGCRPTIARFGTEANDKALLDVLYTASASIKVLELRK